MGLVAYVLCSQQPISHVCLDAPHVCPPSDILDQDIATVCRLSCGGSMDAETISGPHDYAPTVTHQRVCL